ncbi:MAG: sigma-54-dependent transcriptional regulator [Alphaproteobacteria bacterium]
MPYDILVIDDEADIRELVCDILKDEGYTTRSAAESMETFKLINEHVPTVVILDIWLQGSELDGLGILEILKKKYPTLPVIIISGHGTIETAVSAIKMGAYDYIEKPFTEDKLVTTTKRACELSKLLKENYELRLTNKYKNEFIGNSQPIIQIKSLVDKVAPTASRILITGESGTGKELLAKLIHKKSKRTKEPFIILNTIGMNPNEVDSELFGDDEMPSINGQPRKIGALELAHGGTLYIDEVADLSLNIQNKFLRFLLDQTIERPKAGKKFKVDVRIITSTSQDLQKRINEGKFRQDLFYRLNVVPIKLPRLSERKEDIALLSEYFIKFLSETSGLGSRKLTEETIVGMQNYSWPGNIRQLRNVIEWLLIMMQGSEEEYITINMLPPEIISTENNIIKSENSNMLTLPLREAREIFERQYLVTQMGRFDGNISKTAAFVGMERSALHRKLKSLNIHSINSLNEEDMLV